MQLSLLLASNGPNFMDCRAAPLCGVVTLETGLGGGKYQHDQPVVHGLWPQVGKYGSSSCTAPSSSAANPTALATCYAPTAPSAEAAEYWFSPSTQLGMSWPSRRLSTGPT